MYKFSRDITKYIFVVCYWDQTQFDDDWDGTVLHKALQAVRCDASSATGYAPAELMLGRKLVYPFELAHTDIDMTGVEYNVSMVQKLQSIHDKNFLVAKTNIGKAQAKYKKKYDKRNRVKKFNLKRGDAVQYKRYLSKRTLSKKELTLWTPASGYYLILKVNYERKQVVLQTPDGKVLQKTQPFDRIRKFRGRL